MRAQRLPLAETIPNLAPMVDVIMVLLIFFLLGASFNLLNEGMLKTELDPRSGPGAGAAVEITPRVRIVLTDVRDGESAAIAVMDQRLGVGDFNALFLLLLERRDAGADTENPVVIASEPGVRWDFVIQALDAAVRAGFENVQFSVSTAVPG